MDKEEKAEKEEKAYKAEKQLLKDFVDSMQPDDMKNVEE